MKPVLSVLLVFALYALPMDAQVARLGGTVDAFTGKWGQPFRSVGGSIYDFQRCAGRTTLARWSVSVRGGRVSAVTRNACPGETLDPAESAREAAAFAPGDAKRVRQFNTDDGWPAEERRSATLAQELPASAFRACEGMAAPGALSYLLSPERQSWMLALGTCP
jgi:hypothetical protein